MTTVEIHLADKPISEIRRIACLSTSRADSGIYRPLWRLLIQNRYDVTCLAGGTHLSEKHGNTIDDLRDIDGLCIVPVAHETGDGSPAGVAAAAGDALRTFGRAIERQRPELVFVLGDRLEMLAATMSAVVAGVPIAHLHGGERTAGAYDDRYRDAITMLSDLHFAALPRYADRIRSMGVDGGRVFSVGALAVDALRAFEPMDVEATSRAVGIDLSKPTALVLFHPETLSAIPAAEQGRIVAHALRGVDLQLVIFGVNADVGCDAVASALADLIHTRGGVAAIASVPPVVFYSTMAHARLMVGNSSCGIIEASSFALPVVNIGNRQGGRARASNVIDVPFSVSSISEAVRLAAGSDSHDRLAGMANPYGDGRAAVRICNLLRGERVDLFH